MHTEVFPFLPQKQIVSPKTWIQCFEEFTQI